MRTGRARLGVTGAGLLAGCSEGPAMRQRVTARAATRQSIPLCPTDTRHPRLHQLPNDRGSLDHAHGAVAGSSRAVWPTVKEKPPRDAWLMASEDRQAEWCEPAPRE